MKELILETRIKVCEPAELDETHKKLYEMAFEAAKSAYAPYSGFHVGAAALLDNGEVVVGSNQENAAYPSGLCAERTTLFYAGAYYPESAVKILAIAAAKGDDKVEFVAPCGACRQVMLEVEQRFGKKMEVMLCGVDRVHISPSAESLLPLCFGKADLEC